MIDTQHTMPIGVIPNQLQALADELGAAKREIAELRGLLMLVVDEMGGFWSMKDNCTCHKCKLKRDIKAVLER